MSEPPSPKDAGLQDTELVARVRDGGASALETIFLAFSGALRAFAFRYVGSRDEAAELVQESQEQLYKESWRRHIALAPRRPVPYCLAVMPPQPAPQSSPRATFEELFRAFHAPLCGFAYRYVRSREVAEELVQDVFLDAWERYEQGHAFDAPKAYLFAAVRNAAASYLRHQGVVERFEPETVELFSHSDPSPDAICRSAELSQALDRAVSRMPERCRLVFTLSREQGLTYAEIAQLLGISPKTVETQMGRAYKALRKSLAPYWP